MKSTCLLVAMGVFALGGCGSTERLGNKGVVRDLIAHPAEAEEIYIEWGVTFDWRGRQVEGPADERDVTFFWSKPGRPVKALAASDQARAAAPEVLRILNTDRESVQVRTREGGNHVWLIHRGRVIASFDYVAAVAVLGDEGHPDWAVGYLTTSSRPIRRPVLRAA